MNRFATMGAVAMAVGLAGCSTAMGRLSFIVPRHVTLPPTTAVKAVEAEDCGDEASLQRAVERALTQAPTANALTDVAINRNASGCIRVTGNAVTLGEKR